MITLEDKLKLLWKLPKKSEMTISVKLQHFTECSRVVIDWLFNNEVVRSLTVYDNEVVTHESIPIRDLGKISKTAKMLKEMKLLND